MAASIGGAEVYFATRVVHNAEWVQADPAVKQRALNNASDQLYRLYRRYDPAERPIPDEAIYEQALWLLRIDDSIRKAEQGVQAVTVSGITVLVQRVNLSVAPQVILILGRRWGRSVVE